MKTSSVSAKAIDPTFFALIITLLALPMFSSVCRAQNVIAWGNSPQTNVPPSATNVIAVAAGNHHSLALRADGTVVGWGSGAEAIVPSNATNISDIAVGTFHSLALRSDGTLLAWGSSNQLGQLNIPADATNVISVAVAGGMNLALKADRTVVGWGDHLSLGLANVLAYLDQRHYDRGG
jgi:alpha-tubulin suppressor-like RCC1 family protein